MTFAEYATQKRARFVSLETSPEWFDKWKWELRYLRLNLPENPVRLIALDRTTGWYDLQQVHAAIGDNAVFDFVLIDAPNQVKKGNSKGMQRLPGHHEPLRWPAPWSSPPLDAALGPSASRRR